ncbi:MAG: ATP-dependent RNA helicase DbpA, partial [Gammaproteobacteria bacterium]|nr:ATP-dependent RNA helicase DbpA [Gammaproteobacteria bacterium]
MSKLNFSSLSIAKPMLEGLEALGYAQMTPIQAQSLPHILDGKDLIAQAKTGSGKTAAFGIGLLNRIKAEKFSVQALVLCPTRELAEQVAKEIRRLASFTQNIKLITLCGGTPLGPQAASLEKGAHIVVATPGRLLDHLSKKTLQLKSVNMLVLDEADRMLDMGFQDAIRTVTAELPKSRQTLLFSATFPDSIQDMSRSIQHKPVSVKVDTEHAQGKIEQLFYEIKKHERNSTLALLLEHYKPASVVIFCKTKRDTQDVADMLNEQGHSAVAIHGDLEQRDRNQVLIRFANQSCPILVATDVAARGLDVKDLAMVINYE